MGNNQIALLAQVPALDTPLESQSKALQLRQLMNQGQVQDMDMQQRRQAIADDERVRSVYSSIDDPAERIKALYRVNPKAAMSAEKGQFDISKVQADIEETKAKTAKSRQEEINMRMQRARDLLGNVNDKQAAATWVQGMYADPDIGKFLSEHVGPVEQALTRIPDPQADPQGFAKWRQASQVSAEKLAEMTAPKVGTRSLGNRAQTTLTDPITGKVIVTDTQTIGQSPDSVASNETQRRGQNMTDQRAREQVAQGKVPTGYRANKDGSLSAIPGGPADPALGGGKMTEDQGKATGWLVQAENAFANMKAATAKNKSASKPGFNDALAAVPSFGLGEAVANSLRGDERQKFMHGASSLSESLLRAATGAGVNKEEAEQKIREITPVAGDSDAVIDQKIASIPLYIESLKVRAGPGAAKAAKVLDTRTAPAAPALPNGWSVEVH